MDTRCGSCQGRSRYRSLALAGLRCVRDLESQPKRPRTLQFRSSSDQQSGVALGTSGVSQRPATTPAFCSLLVLSVCRRPEDRWSEADTAAKPDTGSCGQTTLWTTQQALLRTCRNPWLRSCWQGTRTWDILLRQKLSSTLYVIRVCIETAMSFQP